MLLGSIGHKVLTSPGERLRRIYRETRKGHLEKAFRDCAIAPDRLSRYHLNDRICRSYGDDTSTIDHSKILRTIALALDLPG